MAKKDYYDVLGVERGADEKAIKRAYKKLAMQYPVSYTHLDVYKRQVLLQYSSLKVRSFLKDF